MATPDPIAVAIQDLARQVSRVAWALEGAITPHVTSADVHVTACAACGCRLMLRNEPRCPACGQEKKDPTDG